MPRPARRSSGDSRAPALTPYWCADGGARRGNRRPDPSGGAAGGRSLLNLAPALPIERAVLADIDVIVANRGEAANLGVDPAKFGATTRQGLVVTRGAEGSTAFLSGGRLIAVPACRSRPSIRPAPATPLSGCSRPGSTGAWVGSRRCGRRAPRQAWPASPAARRPRCRIRQQSTMRCGACRIEGAASPDRPPRSSLISGVAAGEVFAEFEEHVLVNRGA